MATFTISSDQKNNNNEAIEAVIADAYTGKAQQTIRIKPGKGTTITLDPSTKLVVTAVEDPFVPPGQQP